MYMMRILVYIILIVFIFSESSFAQGEALDGEAKDNVLQELEDILKRIDPGDYRVQQMFKEFGGDTFEVRHFIIKYRSNTNNPLYGYDYEIAELLNQDTFITMTQNKSLYVIFTENKIISESELPDHIDLGSYFENIRSSFIINDVFQPFLNGPSSQISVIDSNNNYYLNRRMNDLAVRHLVINKQTRLPSMWSSIIKSQDFDLAQTLEVHFEFSQKMNSLPADAISIAKYLAAGYEFIVSAPDTSAKLPIDHTISFDKQNVLLNYPFFLPEDDTVRIRNSTAEYILLDFWYASCLPCLKALPELNNLAEQYVESGLVVLGINCFDKGIKEKLALKMRDKGIYIPLLFGSKELINMLGITRFPTYYLIHPDRKFELVYGGIEGVKQTIERIFKRD